MTCRHGNRLSSALRRFLFHRRFPSGLRRHGRHRDRDRRRYRERGRAIRPRTDQAAETRHHDLGEPRACHRARRRDAADQRPPFRSDETRHRSFCHRRDHAPARLAAALLAADRAGEHPSPRHHRRLCLGRSHVRPRDRRYRLCHDRRRQAVGVLRDGDRHRRQGAGLRHPVCGLPDHHHTEAAR